MESNNTETETPYSAPHVRTGLLRGFYTIFGGQSLSIVGSNLVQFALVWWLTSTSGSAVAVAWLIPLLAAARRRKEQMEDCDKKKRSDQQLANDRLSIKETGA